MLRFAALIPLSLLPLQSQEVFDVRSRLVLVPVTVTDAKGKFVEGLAEADFTLLDNGKPRKASVDTFESGAAPIAMVVAVQSSGVSAPALEKIRKIGAMIQPLITGDRGCAAVMSFSDQIRWLQECTNDPAKIADAFHRLQRGEEKAGRMIDAVQQAVKRLGTRAGARRVVLLISESRDRGSESELQDAVIDAMGASVTVYAATYSPFKTAMMSRPSESTRPEFSRGRRLPPTDENRPAVIHPQRLPPPEQRVDIRGGMEELSRLAVPQAAKALAEATGGAVFSFARQKSLERIVEKLGAELHSQYVLSFAPDAAAAPGFHALAVKTPDKHHRVRTRSGYWSSVATP